jgi:hypothetical protein
MVKQTRYSLIKSTTNFNELVFSGVISASLANWVSVYETFLDCLSKVKNPTPKERRQCITCVLEYYNNKISEVSVYKIIQYMES